MFANNVSTNLIIIGLTGGIGTGKSTASLYFKSLGIPVIDSDHIVSTLWKEHEEMIKKAEAAFNMQIRSYEDRRKLANRIFENKHDRIKINEIVHPYVYEKIEQEKRLYHDQPIIVIDMPLLFEVGYQKHVDFTILVYIPQILQIKRIKERSKLTYRQIKDRIHSQMSLSIKKQMADFVIDNRGEIVDLHRQIDIIIKGLNHEKQ